MSKKNSKLEFKEVDTSEINPDERPGDKRSRLGCGFILGGCHLKNQQNFKSVLAKYDKWGCGFAGGGCN